MADRKKSEIDQEIDQLLNSAEPVSSKDDEETGKGVNIKGDRNFINVGGKMIIDRRKTFYFEHARHPTDTNNDQHGIKLDTGNSGRVVTLTAILFLGVALAAWPFVRTLLPDPPRASLFYKVPPQQTITPVAIKDNSIDLLFFTGCAHQRSMLKSKPIFHMDNRYNEI